MGVYLTINKTKLNTKTQTSTQNHKHKTTHKQTKGKQTTTYVRTSNKS